MARCASRTTVSRVQPPPAQPWYSPLSVTSAVSPTRAELGGSRRTTVTSAKRSPRSLRLAASGSSSGRTSLLRRSVDVSAYSAAYAGIPLLWLLLDRARVDDRLHRSRNARRAEREQELPGLVLHHLGGLHVLEDVDAVHRQQDLVHLEHAGVLLERQHLQAPGIGADHRHLALGEVARAADAEAGLDRAVALVVLADQLGPAGMEQHHVAALNRLDALALHGALDLGAIERGAFLDDVGVEVARHVEQDAARRDRRHLLDAELLQPVGGDEVGPLVAVVVDIVDADVAEAVELRADADPARDDVVVIGCLARPERLAGVLTRLQNGERKSARRKRRRVLVGLDPEPVALALGDELRRRERLLRRHVVQVADLVVLAVLRGKAGLLRLLRVRRAREQRCHRKSEYRRPGLHGSSRLKSGSSLRQRQPRRQYRGRNSESRSCRGHPRNSVTRYFSPSARRAARPTSRSARARPDRQRRPGCSGAP